MKHDEMEMRILEVTEYILLTKGTIRQCANHFKMSKSTVHKDLHRLRNVNYTKYNEVKKILNTNWEEKYIRGGLATQRKYAIMAS
jgi:putative DeoR family transcriptional regulator (stage III sporulation protein D)